jgi:hypothetical protein
MTIEGLTIATDEDLDRLVALKLARDTPLPVELALMNERQAREYQEFVRYFEMYGLKEDIFVQIFIKHLEKVGMAAAIGKSATYGDRLAHYAAGKGLEDPVKVLDARTALSTPPGTDNGQKSSSIEYGADVGREAAGINREACQRAAATDDQNRPAEKTAARTTSADVRRPFFRSHDGTLRFAIEVLDLEEKEKGMVENEFNEEEECFQDDI